MLLRAYLPSRLVAVISSSTPPCGVRPVARESSARIRVRVRVRVGVRVRVRDRVRVS